MLRLALLMLRDRPSRAVATFIALWCGAVIITFGASLIESGNRYEGAPERYAGTDAVVAFEKLPFTFQESDGETDVEEVLLPEGGRVDIALAERIAAVPGVAAAVADISVAVGSPAGTSLPTWGHGWASAALTPYRMETGTPPRADTDVVVGDTYAAKAGLRPGDTAAMLVGGQSREYRVAGVAVPETPTTRQLAVFFTDAEAANLAGRPATADAIGVRFAAGADVADTLGLIRAEAEPSQATVYTGPDRGLVEEPAEATAQEFMVSFGGTFASYAVLVTIIVVAGTTGLSVRSRHRDIALLRAIAATPRQVRRLVIGEGVCIAAVATVLAIPAGWLATRVFRDELVERDIVPAALTLTMGSLTFMITIGSVLLTAFIAGWAASRRTSRIRPTEALGEASAEPETVGWTRAFFGILFLAGGVGLSFLARAVRGDAAVGGALGLLFTLTIAVALLAPWINRVAAWVCAGPLTAGWKASGYLAVANLRSNARRMAPVLTSLVLAVALGGSVWFLQTNLERETTGQNRRGTLAEHVLVDSGLGLSPEVAREARTLPGTQAATAVRRTTVIIRRFGDVDTYTAQGVDPEGLEHTVDLGVGAGSLADLRGETVAISQMVADHLRWRVGDQVTVWLGDGTQTRLRVVALYERGMGFGDLTVPRAVLDGHTASDLDDLVLVRSRSGEDQRQALAALAQGYPGVGLTDPEALGRELSDAVKLSAWTNQVFVGILIAYVVIAAANTLVMAALSRGRELAVLRLVGVTRREIMGMVRAEQVTLLGAAVLIGGTIAALALTSLVSVVTGRTVPYVPPLGWLCVIGGTALLALVATILPVRRVLRTPPVEGIGLKE
ncbi:MAG: FtsX-like permease family protein [Dactylosporangium sp.]|nr:FtsX-like permease family protein [Dactylosporangium sp.]NNJ59849.1 FtsX-like permease family protein [Dactylosporangium sp.]